MLRVLYISSKIFLREEVLERSVRAGAIGITVIDRTVWQPPWQSGPRIAAEVSARWFRSEGKSRSSRHYIDRGQSALLRLTFPWLKGESVAWASSPSFCHQYVQFQLAFISEKKKNENVRVREKERERERERKREREREIWVRRSNDGFLPAPGRPTGRRAARLAPASSSSSSSSSRPTYYDPTILVESVRSEDTLRSRILLSPFLLSSHECDDECAS